MSDLGSIPVIPHSPLNFPGVISECGVRSKPSTAKCGPLLHPPKKKIDNGDGEQINFMIVGLSCFKMEISFGGEGELLESRPVVLQGCSWQQCSGVSDPFFIPRC